MSVIGFTILEILISSTYQQREAICSVAWAEWRTLDIRRCPSHEPVRILLSRASPPTLLCVVLGSAGRWYMCTDQRSANVCHDHVTMIPVG